MTIGFGIIGLGTWGRKHARVYASHPRATLAAVCDLQEERAKSVANEFGGHAYTDFNDLLADKNVQAVSIVTPDFAHLDPVIAAAKAGKHILLEKPLATTVEQARRMVDAIEQAGVTCMVDMHNRWNPSFVIAKQRMAAGEIGKPLCAHLKLHDNIYVPTRMLSWANRSSPLWFLGSHGADLLRWMFDDEIAQVYCVAHRGLLDGMGIGTIDVCHSTFVFKGGATATMETGWVLPADDPVIIDFKFDMICDKGGVKINHSHNRTIELFGVEGFKCPNVVADVEVHGKEHGLTLESIRHFVDCIADDKQPMVTVRDGLVNTQVLCAAEESMRTGEAVKL